MAASAHHVLVVDDESLLEQVEEEVLWARSEGYAIIVVGIGGCTTAFQSLSNTLALVESEDHMQGRVQSLMQLSFAGFGIAAAPIGALAEVIGLRATMVIMGAIALTGTAVFHALETLAERRSERLAAAPLSLDPTRAA